MEELSVGVGEGDWSSFVKWNLGEMEPLPRPLPPPPPAEEVEKAEVEEDEMKEGLVMVEEEQGNFVKLLLIAVLYCSSRLKLQ